MHAIVHAKGSQWAALHKAVPGIFFVECGKVDDAVLVDAQQLSGG